MAEGRVTVAKTSSEQVRLLVHGNYTHQGPLVASSLRSECYSPGPLQLSNVRSFLDSTYREHTTSMRYMAGLLIRQCKVTQTYNIILESFIVVFTSLVVAQQVGTP